MFVKYILSVSSTVVSVGFRKPMPSKPIPKLGEMPFVPLISQKIPFLKLIELSKFFHISRCLEGSKAPLRQMDVDFLMFGSFTVHRVDAKEKNARLLRFSGPDSADIGVRRDRNKRTRTRCTQHLIQSFHVVRMVATEHIDGRFGEHGDRVRRL